MPRFPALLRGAIACLIVAAASGTALAKPVPIERRLVHPDGVSIVLQTIDFRDNSIVLSATIANPGERQIRLDRARSFVLDDGAHGVYHLNPPAENPQLRIPAQAQMTADLVFIGPLASAARELTLSINQGIGTPDNPYDDAPAFSTTLPADGRAEANGGPAASHPDGAGLRVRGVPGHPDCLRCLAACDQRQRPDDCSGPGSQPRADRRPRRCGAGRGPGRKPGAGGTPGDRLDADLIFDCRTLDASGALTLITNRGTAGTTDNPYDTLPVFTLKVPVEHSDAALPASSRDGCADCPLASVGGRGSDSAGATRSCVARSNPTCSTPPAPRPARCRRPRDAGAPAPARGSGKTPAPRSVPQLEAALHARTYRGLRIVLPADALFGSAPDTLDANADPLLAQLAELIAKTRPREVEVAGHTNSVGTDADNLTLSKERAHAVAAWLEAHAPKRRPRFVEQGFGRTRPVRPNHKSDGSDNPEGRAQNRRIEVLLRRRSSGAEQPVAGVAQPGQDIAVVVENAVEDRGGHDRHSGKDAVQFRDAFGRRDEADELDRARPHLDQARDRRHRRIAGREHRIEQDNVALGQIVGQLQVVFDRRKVRRLAIDPDMADPRRRHEVEHAVEDAVVGAQIETKHNFLPASTGTRARSSGVSMSISSSARSRVAS